ncbi:MAG: [protein-PII] uridylyltransferase [Nitrospirae bacterium]|nr:[protein-PII] uridylyltransferase [Magnetococcales bacterium]HAT50851.1 [protein-PII] uridylyltransferase [Alphaproteobacteria bacterium]
MDNNGSPHQKLSVIPKEFAVQDFLDSIEFESKLNALLPQAATGVISDEARRQIIDTLRTIIALGRDHLQTIHRNGASGEFIVKGHAALMDVVLQRIFRMIHTHPNPERESLALVATGGYGRGELAPFSDIDLLFILPDSSHKEQDRLVERMLYCLWDLGLDIGHAVRQIDECVQQARQDLEIRTSMLESRYLAGDREQFDTYKKKLFKKVLDKDPDSFLRAKLLEQTKRHEKFGNSFFYLEPNIKENPGGLRDIQTFAWISKYRYKVDHVKDLVERGIITSQEYRVFTRSLSFLRRVRNALHYRAGRREDRLTFHHQIEIAKEFGYRDRPGRQGVEQFMRRYYQVAQQVGDLSRIFLRKYQEEHLKIRWWNKRRLEEHFQLVGDKVALRLPEQIDQDPLLLLKIFNVAQRHMKTIHPDTERLIRRRLDLIDRDFQRSQEAANVFLAILNGRHAVAWTLRRMNQLGVLGRYIPEFGRIMWQSQHDMFHVFTVDEHTLLAVAAVRLIQDGKLQEELPLATQVFSELDNHGLLILAVLLHDIAKGRGGDHTKEGAIIAGDVCQRLGLVPEDRDIVTWLVENHLVFSRVAFRRDLGDPATITAFAEQIKDTRRLKMLFLLTMVDIRAVGPGVWTPWKATLLKQLYHFALETLEKGAFKTSDIARHAEERKAEAIRLLVPENDPILVAQHFDRFYPDYFIQYDVRSLVDHFRAFVPLREEPMSVVFWTTPATSTTELLLHTPDHPGLMARISGALTAEGVNILSASITTTKDGMAFDSFVLQNNQGKAIESKHRLDKIEQTLVSVLKGKTWPEALLKHVAPAFASPSPFRVPVSIEVDNSMDGFTILEITSLDRVGLLFTITREVERQGLQIRTAKISTYGERAVDVFYLKDIFGLKLDNRKIDSLTMHLTKAIENMDHHSLSTPPSRSLAKEEEEAFDRAQQVDFTNGK